MLKYWTAETDFKAENESSTLMFETPELVRLNLGKLGYTVGTGILLTVSACRESKSSGSATL